MTRRQMASAQILRRHERRRHLRHLVSEISDV